MNQTAFLGFYSSWDSGCWVSGHIQVDTKRLLATGAVLTSQDIDKLENTVGKVEPSTGHTIQLVGTGLAVMHVDKFKQNL